MNEIKKEMADMIRSKSDDDLLAMVLDREPTALVTKPVVSTKPRASSSKSNHQDHVYKVVNGRSGVTVTEVADITGLPRASVKKAIDALKSQGKVFQAGERRYTRYATSQEAAERSSKLARNEKG